MDGFTRSQMMVILATPYEFEALLSNGSEE